jgi:transcription termination/antitermination protein NusA
VGIRGNRVKNIIRELNNEKIDIIPYSENPVTLLENAMRPIEIKKLFISDDKTSMTMIVSDEDYPAALGKRGMNARLNADLAEVDLQVQKMSQYQEAMTLERAQIALAEDPTLDAPLAIDGMSRMILESVISAGFDTERKVLNATREQLAAIPEISLEMADKILEQIRKKRG